MNILSLLEAMKSLPSKNKGSPEDSSNGYVDYEKIDGHHVHVIHKYLGKGKYSSTLQINGSHDLNTDIKPLSKIKILSFAKKAAKEFIENIKPIKMTVTPNDNKKKSDVYGAWAKQTGGVVSKGNKRISVKFPGNEGKHQPSGHTPSNKTDPAYHFTKHSGKINKHLGVAAFLTVLTK